MPASSSSLSSSLSFASDATGSSAAAASSAAAPSSHGNPVGDPRQGERVRLGGLNARCGASGRGAGVCGSPAVLRVGCAGADDWKRGALVEEIGPGTKGGSSS